MTNTLTPDQQDELDMLRINLAAGTVAGRKASKAQQQVRRRRIRELEGR